MVGVVYVHSELAKPQYKEQVLSQLLKTDAQLSVTWLTSCLVLQPTNSGNSGGDTVPEYLVVRYEQVRYRTVARRTAHHQEKEKYLYDT